MGRPASLKGVLPHGCEYVALSDHPGKSLSPPVSFCSTAQCLCVALSSHRHPPTFEVSSNWTVSTFSYYPNMHTSFLKVHSQLDYCIGCVKLGEKPAQLCCLQISDHLHQLSVQEENSKLGIVNSSEEFTSVQKVSVEASCGSSWCSSPGMFS